MKTKVLLNFLILSFFVFTANAQINVDCNQNVGIGGTPGSDKLEITGAVKINPGYGSIYIDNGGYAGYPNIWGGANIGKSDSPWYVMNAYYFIVPSDERLKENIRGISNGLDIILKLNGKRYDYKAKPSDNEQIKIVKKNHAGFIAQDVIKIIPEAVVYDDSVDIYSMDYTKIIPFITEAIKEQHQIIESLQSEIQELKAGSVNSNLKSASMITAATNIEAKRVNELYQNTPNPFSQNTTIGYSLNENVHRAMICIYDMNGKQLKCTPLELAAHGNIMINGNEFKAGMYMYSLIVDEKLVDTKRMILTD